MLATLKDKVIPLFGAKNTSIIGVSLHSNSVRAVKLEQEQQAWFISRIEELTVTNESMWPQTIAAIAEKLEFEQGKINLVLPSHRYQIVQIDQPSVPDEELRASLPWAVKELVSTPVEQLVMDFIDLPATNIGNKLNVITASKAVIQPIVDYMHQAKLGLDVITIEELVNFRIQPVGTASTLFVTQSVGEEACVQIVRDGQLYFTRRLRGFSRIGSYSAEEIKMGIADALSLEIQRSMDYYDSQLKQPPVQTVVMSIASEHSDVLIEQLNQDMPIDVKALSIPAELIKEIEVPQSYMLAVGAALARFEGMGGQHE